ncbi:MULTISPECIES: YraN family protein [Legionella]|uniref:UPF0102 protein EKM59_04615 n=1 Tax=Legionella septentrionalis TaxID=2498109 RepID=A0A433JKB6_9GAMM|nr:MULTISPECIES: YraN family protein [Legionella]MCP0914873.1 YraN family protein [Legionella sp. 27cVA30]RUQ88823.1 YraN family protein [Legionella septentrionalis]RUR02936.1 YraN family protein [Legionella septentrionalis]RUR11535.1 YraN family protein [Legionella septentrionalis]RUR16800.1 YraN family protein [Legionella septentrionalis]
MSQEIGFAAEAHTRRYLHQQGLQWITSNYRCRFGEIDLIMRDEEYLVFIEVRARSGNAFGGAAASVTYSKKQKIIKTASFYLAANKLQDKQAVRFDLVSLEGMPAKLTWIKNAFGLDF